LLQAHAKQMFGVLVGVSSPVELARQNEHIAKPVWDVLARVIALSAARHEVCGTCVPRHLYIARRRAGGPYVTERSEPAQPDDIPPGEYLAPRAFGMRAVVAAWPTDT